MTLEITTAVTLDRKEKISMDRWRPNPPHYFLKKEIKLFGFEQEGDYQEGDVDQEGMDIEYFSQYKVSP